MLQQLPTPENPDVLLPWDVSVANNTHNVRVLCDLSGLAYEDKQIITCCVDIESGFQDYHLSVQLKGQPVADRNLREDGSLSSTDWGIVQINDKYHIGAKLDFPSVDFVLANPQETVQFMVDMFKAGKISMWDSYINVMKGSTQYYRDMAQKYGIKVDVTSIK